MKRFILQVIFFGMILTASAQSNWSVNPSLYENSMTITGVIQFEDSIYEHTSGIVVAAFVDDTVCMTSDYYCDGLVTTVGLEESNLASNVKLYPNPSQGNFNVSFTTAVESDYQIEVVDITGRTVNVKTGETKYGENQVRFDADLPDGVYMVKVIVEGDVSTSRLVIRS